MGPIVASRLLPRAGGHRRGDIVAACSPSPGRWRRRSRRIRLDDARSPPAPRRERSARRPLARTRPLLVGAGRRDAVAWKEKPWWREQDVGTGKDRGERPAGRHRRPHAPPATRAGAAPRARGARRGLRQPAAAGRHGPGPDPAPDFTLTDQNGDALQLSALRGRPIALTFLYTQCPDVCPLTADKLRRTADLLGSAADQVAFVAVSVDPPHDDAAAAQAFVAQHRLTGRLRYLVGTQAELQPVWSAYYMYVAPSPSDDPAERAAANYAARTATHTDALFVIDRQGRERTLLRSDFEPEALASTLKRLLGE